MAFLVRWNNTSEFNPVMTAKIRRVIPENVQTALNQTKSGTMSLAPVDVGSFQQTDLAMTPKESPLDIKKLSWQETAILSASLVPEEEATGTPVTLDQLYYPGPQGESFLFWGVFRPSALALYQLPAGNINYFTTPPGKIAKPQRFQIVNTSEQDVTLSFFFGTDLFTAPRLRSDVIVPALGEYDLSCAVECVEGESLGLCANVNNALIIAISGHLDDVV